MHATYLSKEKHLIMDQRAILRGKQSVIVSHDVIEATTGQSNEHSATDTERLSRYSTLSHQAGIRFFSPESYPTSKNDKYYSELMKQIKHRIPSEANKKTEFT
jgi:hypothetical protein